MSKERGRREQGLGRAGSEPVRACASARLHASCMPAALAWRARGNADAPAVTRRPRELVSALLCRVLLSAVHFYIGIIGIKFMSSSL